MLWDVGLHMLRTWEITCKPAESTRGADHVNVSKQIMLMQNSVIYGGDLQGRHWWIIGIVK